jgi:Type II intron maturase
MKRQIGTLLREPLTLQLSDTKPLISHARTQAARCLGDEIRGLNNNRKLDGRGHRRINGQIGLRVPRDVIEPKRARHLQQGKAIHRPELLNDAVCSLVVQYQQEYRGLVEYDRLAYNLHQRNRLKWTMERSLVQTLAHTLRLSVREVYRRDQTTIQTDQGPRVGWQVTVERKEGKRPLVARWGGLSLSRNTKASLNDSPLRICGPRTELEVRLQADTCELCGAEEAVEVHPIRALKDLRRQGRAERPFWVQVMAARQRKTLGACRHCHDAIHRGALIQRNTATGETLESRVLRKA